MSELRSTPEGGHGDVPAYVLGALDSAARERFEAHAATCSECQRELTSLQPVGTRLALAVPQVGPPPSLRSKVLARAVLTPPNAAERNSQSTLVGGPWPVPVTPLPVAAQTPRRRWWRLGERASMAVAAAAMVVAVIGGGMAFNERQATQRTTEQAAVLAETLSMMYQPGMVWRALQGTEAAPQSKGRMFFTPDGVQAVVMTYDLPPLSVQRAYQFWLNNPEDGKRISGGVFKVDDRGRGHLLVRTSEAVQQFKGCGITLEPAKGSAWPTGPRMMAGQI